MRSVAQPASDRDSAPALVAALSRRRARISPAVYTRPRRVGGAARLPVRPVLAGALLAVAIAAGAVVAAFFVAFPA